jgi:triphosphoribosyl-dephospho-CoA synthetase
MVLSNRLRAWAALVVAATQTATVLGHPFINTSPRAAADCSKEVLQAAADAYVAAQTAGNVTLLEGVVATAGWEYEQNNKKMEAKAGVLGKALKLDHRRTNFDLVACATYTELISASDPANPYVMGVQLRHRVEDGKVVLVDVIASTTGSWLFNATKTLEYVRQEKWDVIPEGKRDKREVIKAAGDAYMDMW